MKIYYDNKKMQKACEDSKLMQKRFGDLAPKLKSRLSDLMAVSNVSELIAGRPHALDYDRKDQFAVDLTNVLRLIFEAANDPIPRCSDRTVDWKMVTMIRIMEIGDYHGK